MKLVGKTALVTGGASGIGEAIAHKLASEGARVLVADLSVDAAREVAEAIGANGGRAEAFAGDLSDEAVTEKCVTAAIDRFGRLDILASNAGIFPFTGEVDQWDVETFDKVMRNNTRSTFLMTRFAIPHLRASRGNIVYTGSITAMMGAAEVAVYGGSKGFIHAFMMGVAMEQAKHGVRANVVAPGAIATSWVIAGAGGPATPEFEQALKDGAAMGRQGTTEELANVVAFVASDEASFVTGSVFVADGGVLPAQGAPGADVSDELRSPPPLTLPLTRAEGSRKGGPSSGKD